MAGRQKRCPGSPMEFLGRSRLAGGADARLRDDFICGRLAMTRTLRGHEGCVNTTVWNHDGTRLVTSGDDLKAIIWDATDSFSTLCSVDTGHVANVFSAKPVPGSADRQLATTGLDGQRPAMPQLTGTPHASRQVRVVDLDHNMNYSIGHSEQRIYRLTFIPDGSPVFLTAQADGKVMQYDLRTRSAPHKLSTAKPATALTVDKAISSYYPWLSKPCPPFDANRDATCMLDTRQSRPLSFTGPSGPRWDRPGLPMDVCSVDIDPVDGQLFAMGWQDLSVRLHDLRKPAATAMTFFPEVCTTSHDVSGPSVAFSRRKEVVSMYHGAPAFLWDVGRPEMNLADERCGTGEALEGEMSYWPDKDPRNMPQQDLDEWFKTRQWRNDSGANLAHLDGSVFTSWAQSYVGFSNVETFLKEICFFGDRQDMVAAGSDDGHCWIFDKASARVLNVVPGDGSFLNCVAPHPNLPWIALSGYESTPKIASPVDHSTVDKGLIEALVHRNVKSVMLDRSYSWNATEPPKKPIPILDEVVRPTKEQLEAISDSVRLAGNTVFQNQRIKEALAKYIKATDYLLRASADKTLQKPFNSADKSLKLMPEAKGSKLWLNLALCLMQLDEAQKTEIMLTELIDTWGPSAKALYRRAQAYLKLNNTDGAVEDATKASQLLPHDATIRRLLEQAHRAKENDKRKAKKLLQSMFS
eukprot:gene5969-1063_t